MAYPIQAQLSTVVDHVQEFSGQPVQLPPLRVTRIVAPSLVEVRDAREKSRYHFRMSEHDHLFVLLPAGTSVATRQAIVVSGLVRTVRGARVTGDWPGASDDLVKRHGNATLLIAARVETADGVDLLSRR
jgi:hypothetical protein